VEAAPKYSVLMSLYIKEKPEYLRLAIDSMLAQTVAPDEIVIVEDGPLTDALYAVLDEYKTKFPQIIRTVRNEKNLGLGLALNAGLKECRNELVARMDTDDISKPDRCEKQLEEFLLNSKLDIVGGNISEFIDSPDNIVGQRIVPQKDADIKEYLKRRCPFNHMTVMFKKDSVLRVGNYIDWFWNEDYSLWIRMCLANMTFANIPSVLVNVRVGKEMYKRRGGWKYFKSETKIQWFMYRRRLISLPRSMYNVVLRLCLQVLMPNWLRGVVFKKFART
jgi:glycosyltransferase involved in cell wall biosynthesis